MAVLTSLRSLDSWDAHSLLVSLPPRLQFLLFAEINPVTPEHDAVMAVAIEQIFMVGDKGPLWIKTLAEAGKWPDHPWLTAYLKSSLRSSVPERQRAIKLIGLLHYEPCYLAAAESCRIDQKYQRHHQWTAQEDVMTMLKAEIAFEALNSPPKTSTRWAFVIACLSKDTTNIQEVEQLAVLLEEPQLAQMAVKMVTKHRNHPLRFSRIRTLAEAKCVGIVPEIMQQIKAIDPLRDSHLQQQMLGLLWLMAPAEAEAFIRTKIVSFKDDCPFDWGLLRILQRTTSETRRRLGHYFLEMGCTRLAGQLGSPEAVPFLLSRLRENLSMNEGIGWCQILLTIPGGHHEEVISALRHLQAHGKNYTLRLANRFLALKGFPQTLWNARNQEISGGSNAEEFSFDILALGLATMDENCHLRVEIIEWLETIACSDHRSFDGGLTLAALQALRIVHPERFVHVCQKLVLCSEIMLVRLMAELGLWKACNSLGPVPLLEIFRQRLKDGSLNQMRPIPWMIGNPEFSIPLSQQQMVDVVLHGEPWRIKFGILGEHIIHYLIALGYHQECLEGHLQCYTLGYKARLHPKMVGLAPDRFWRACADYKNHRPETIIDIWREIPAWPETMTRELSVTAHQYSEDLADESKALTFLRIFEALGRQNVRDSQLSERAWHLLHTGNDPSLRSAAATALGSQREVALLPILERTRDDTHSLVRLTGARLANKQSSAPYLVLTNMLTQWVAKEVDIQVRTELLLSLDVVVGRV